MFPVCHGSAAFYKLAASPFGYCLYLSLLFLYFFNSHSFLYFVFLSGWLVVSPPTDPAVALESMYGHASVTHIPVYHLPVPSFVILFALPLLSCDSLIYCYGVVSFLTPWLKVKATSFSPDLQEPALHGTIFSLQCHVSMALFSVSPSPSVPVFFQFFISCISFSSPDLPFPSPLALSPVPYRPPRDGGIVTVLIVLVSEKHLNSLLCFTFPFLFVSSLTFFSLTILCITFYSHIWFFAPCPSLSVLRSLKRWMPSSHYITPPVFCLHSLLPSYCSLSFTRHSTCFFHLVFPF